MTLFISYSSSDADVVTVLERNLQAFGKKVWRDNEVTGGQAWWAAILEQIRECDVFIFALSRNSLESDPCALEYGYARALGLPILPVEIGDVPTESRRNHAVYSEQLVDYRNPTADAAIALVRAVGEREASRKPLPDPLPPEPPIPYEYLLRLSTVIRMREPIPYVEQRQLIGEFRDALNRERNESVRGSIRGLLVELKERPDTSHSVEVEIDELLAKWAPAVAAPVDPLPTPPVDTGTAPGGSDQTVAAHPPPVVPPAPYEPPFAPGGSPPPPAPAPYVPASVAPAAGPISVPPPPAPPTGPPSGGGGRRLGIILGVVGAVVVVGAIVATAVALWPKGGGTASSNGGLPSAEVECWDGSDEPSVAQCPAVSGAEGLEFAFSPGEGPEGSAPDCDEQEPSADDAADGAIVEVYCTWSDIPGTSVSLIEWDMEPDELMTYWADYFEWDDEFTMTMEDERIGATWELATTVDSGDVWFWAAVFDDLPFSVDIFASAELGGSEATAEAAWNTLAPLNTEEIAALPGIVE